MRATRIGSRTALALGLTVLAASPAAARQERDGPERETGAAALEAFGALVVGEWQSEGSRHEFSWGVGRRAIHSRSWFGDPGSWTLVSEGFWYWDPGEGTIRGRTVAIDMGIDLFEHRSRVDGRSVVSDLVSHGDFGGVYVERWTFDDAGYDWVLEQDGARVMGARYTKVH